VADIQVVEEISAGQGEKKESIRPKEGYDLVVVTMQAMVESPCRVPMATNEFSVVWEQRSSRTIFGKTETSSSFYVYASVAIALSDDWSLAPIGRSVTVTSYFTKQGTALFRVAFILPKAAKDNLVIRYPVVTRGKVQKESKGSPP